MTPFLGVPRQMVKLGGKELCGDAATYCRFKLSLNKTMFMWLSYTNN